MVEAWHISRGSLRLVPSNQFHKSSRKFYPVKGEFSDENSDGRGFHKLGNPTFSHPQLAGAVATFH